ncbi:MAG TPA: hypothetical protein DEB39_00535 [Planctomycetaceae bacterium]|nr:hypothetical protein [Planctomycetaceae bacterium]
MLRIVSLTLLLCLTAGIGCQTGKSAKRGFHLDLDKEKIAKLAATDPFPRADQPVPIKQEAVSTASHSMPRWR